MSPLCIYYVLDIMCVAFQDIITHVFVNGFETHVRKTSAFMKWFPYIVLKETFTFFCIFMILCNKMLRDFIRPLWGWIRHVMATEHFRVITILLYLNLTNHKMNPNNYQMWTHTHLPYVIKDLDTIIRNNPFSHNHDKILKSKLATTKGEPKQTTTYS